MATYETTLHIPRPVEQTFAFVSDFRNAAKWDPRTFSVEKTTDGEIAVGTRFVLRGGMIPKHLVPRRLSMLDAVVAMPLPYDVTALTPNQELVLEGETPVFKYQDRLTFEKDGAGTRLTYSARLDFKGPLKVANPVLQLMFKRIGDDATKDIAVCVVEGTAGKTGARAA
jgi:carbon monoxide dehydrogenase subunit G